MYQMNPNSVRLTGTTCHRSAILRHGGFTLLELMITITVAGILMVIAVPSFQHAISSTNLSGAHNDLVAALRYARSEAITRNGDVEIIANGNWHDGWTVQVPASGGNPVEVLRTHAALDGAYEITAFDSNGNNPASIDFQAHFDANPDPSVCFTLKDTNDYSDERCLRVSPSRSVHSVPADATGKCPTSC